MQPTNMNPRTIEQIEYAGAWNALNEEELLMHGLTEWPIGPSGPTNHEIVHHQCTPIPDGYDGDADNLQELFWEVGDKHRRNGLPCLIVIADGTGPLGRAYHYGYIGQPGDHS